MPGCDIEAARVPYRRPIDRFSKPSKNLLFYEARFFQAIVNTDETRLGDIRTWTGGTLGLYPLLPVNIPGQHGKMTEFTAVFADGHGQVIKLRKEGDQYNPHDFDGTPPDRNPRFYKLMLRGPSWQFDNFREQASVKDMMQWTWFNWPPPEPEYGRLITGISP